MYYYFFSGFLGVFRFKAFTFKQNHALGLIEYVKYVERDINTAFKELTKYNERK